MLYMRMQRQDLPCPAKLQSLAVQVPWLCMSIQAWSVRVQPHSSQQAGQGSHSAQLFFRPRRQQAHGPLLSHQRAWTCRLRQE